MNAPFPSHQSKATPWTTDSIYDGTQSNSPTLPVRYGDFIYQFPCRLHQMLETVEKEGNTSIISWLPGHPQDTFKVHRKEEFTEHVLPRFFDQTKLKSFLRQLNVWGFERVLDSGPRHGGYRHSLFVKNRPDLCAGMRRTKIKGRKQGDPAVGSQQQLPEMEPQQNELLSHPIFGDHRQYHGGQQERGGTKMNDIQDETSFDTIEYERIPDNIPVAADLSRMYTEEMKNTISDDEHPLPARYFF
ncbi:unnamed protein product [Cylindrotheca closterium]|uniref:HSF-type DNA-binding domain-containing protein n=1 Tax=Cylindrotheca closterium TaxID=2856 RepID=A0AAD2CM32_9STRA|nr:unnamed protein product [Cylindrotheca closterium]